MVFVKKPICLLFLTAAIFGSIHAMQQHMVENNKEVRKFISQTAKALECQFKALSKIMALLDDASRLPSPSKNFLIEVHIVCDKLCNITLVNERRTIASILELMDEQPFSQQQLQTILERRKPFFGEFAQSIQKISSLLDDVKRQNPSQDIEKALTSVALLLNACNQFEQEHRAEIVRLLVLLGDPQLLTPEQPDQQVPTTTTTTQAATAALPLNQPANIDDTPQDEFSNPWDIEIPENFEIEPELTARLNETLDYYHKLVEQLDVLQKILIAEQQAYPIAAPFCQLCLTVKDNVHTLHETLATILSDVAKNLTCQALWKEVNKQRRLLKGLEGRIEELVKHFKQFPDEFEAKNEQFVQLENLLSKNQKIQRSIEYEYQRLRAATVLQKIKLNVHGAVRNLSTFVQVGKQSPEFVVHDAMVAHDPLARDIVAAIGHDFPVHEIFAGPPGTGKSLLAQVVAQVAGVPCFVVDTPCF